MSSCVGTTGLTYLCKVRFHLISNSTPHTYSER